MPEQQSIRKNEGLVIRNVSEVLSELPRVAMMPDLADENKVICIKRGEKGYYEMNGWTAGDARLFNERNGITKPQIEAMRTGSCFGFDVPGADPKNCL